MIRTSYSEKASPHWRGVLISSWETGLHLASPELCKRSESTPGLVGSPDAELQRRLWGFQRELKTRPGLLLAPPDLGELLVPLRLHLPETEIPCSSPFCLQLQGATFGLQENSPHLGEHLQAYGGPQAILSSVARLPRLWWDS